MVPILRCEYFFRKLVEIKLLLMVYLMPDKNFMKNLDKNPFHPFEQLNSFLFEFSYKYYYLGIMCVTLTITFVSVIIFNLKSSNHKSVSFFLSLFLLFLISVILFLFSIVAFTKRTIRINLLESKYELFFQDKLIATNHVHNLYIRLNERHLVKTKQVYRLTLCGKDIDSISVSPYSYGLQKLRYIGRRLAQNLFINYFDIQDLSLHHSIINYCPLDESKTDMWKFLIQEKEIILQKKPIYWIKPNLIRSNLEFKKQPFNNSMSLNLAVQDLSQPMSTIDSAESKETRLSSQDLRLQLSKLANTLKAVKNISNVL